MERKGMSLGFEIDFKCHLTPLAFWTGKLSISRERVERILFLAPASHRSDVAITEKTEKKGKAKLSSVAFNINRVLYMPSISVRHRRLDIDDWIKKGTDETTTCRLRTIITIYWFDLIQDHGREIIETKKRMKQMTCVRWRQRKTPLFGSFRILFFFLSFPPAAIILIFLRRSAMSNLCQCLSLDLLTNIDNAVHYTTSSADMYGGRFTLLASSRRRLFPQNVEWRVRVVIKWNSPYIVVELLVSIFRRVHYQMTSCPRFLFLPPTYLFLCVHPPPPPSIVYILMESNKKMFVMRR